jgi:predicted histone-like DNA-binding protein
MAITFRPVRKLNPSKREEPAKYFPTPVLKGKINTRQMAKRIASKTTLQVPDTYAVLEALLQELPSALLDGEIVSFDDFGTFRLSMKGEGTDSAAAMRASNIQKVRVIFRPGKEFAETLGKAVFEKEKKKRK